MSVRIDSYTTLGSGTYGTVSRVTVMPPSAHAISQTIWAGKWMKRFDTLAWHQVILSELCAPQSSSLPKVIGAWDNDDGIMIVMEGFESNALHLMNGCTDPIPVLRDVSRGLVDVHDAGIVHRDVKLDNVLLRKGRAYLCDFGLASSIYSPVNEDESQICTFVTRAPEIWSRTMHSFAADMWSLGCVAYNLTTGKHIMGMNAESLTRRDVIDQLRAFSHPTLTHPAYTSTTLATFYIMAKCIQFKSSSRPSPRELLTSIADGRRRRTLRKRPSTVTPPPLKLVGSKTFAMQSYLSGQTFLGRPESCFVIPNHRRAELMAVRGALAKLEPSYEIPFKTLLMTIDLFDRLPHKSLRTRICLAIYVCGLASNYAYAMTSVVMALWDSNERAKEMEALFLPALASLGWSFESTFTVLQSMCLHEDTDIQGKILSEYLFWPDARSREHMIRDALSRQGREVW